MAHTRICGARCHHAIHATCRCWCGGLFHGAVGLDARLEFCGTFICNTLPTTEEAFKAMTQPHLFNPKAGEWRDRVEAAVAARKK